MPSINRITKDQYDHILLIPNFLYVRIKDSSPPSTPNIMKGTDTSLPLTKIGKPGFLFGSATRLSRNLLWKISEA
jgi:hypothetical protein